MTLAALTLREREVALAAGEGLCNKEIGIRLNIATNTVAAYLHHLARKGITRLGCVHHLARSHERDQATRLNVWVQKHERALPPEALAEIQAIVADQVAAFLR